MRTVRIPVDAFMVANPALNLGNILRVKLQLTGARQDIFWPTISRLAAEQREINDGATKARRSEAVFLHGADSSAAHGGLVQGRWLQHHERDQKGQRYRVRIEGHNLWDRSCSRSSLSVVTRSRTSPSTPVARRLKAPSPPS